MEILRHSTSHIMAAAMKKIYPNIKFGIGPAIADGFYYDVDFERSLTPQDLLKIEKEMKKIISQKLPFEKKEISKNEALKIFKDQPYKIELINELENISIYTLGDFVDLCAGPHVENSKGIDPEAFKLTRLAGAYWRGDEKNKMLQRIYGVVFEKKEELEKHLHLLEEAEKRDHRKLGRELDLFLVDSMVGMGLVMWQPKGAMLWRIMEDFWYAEHLKAGYELVRTPHIGNRQLWETSGHWGFYNESMYPSLEVGQTLRDAQQGKKAVVREEYLLKPMNCPFHVSIFNSRPRSYRELPKRWAETGTVYRYEKSGELSGLTRVRGFTQDDAHIFCRKDQVKAELKRVADFILFILRVFGFEEFSVYLSLRDPHNTEKYAGNNEGWEFTQKILEEVAQEQKLNYIKEEGEAAFYGPKLDYKIKDALGREWQCSTLQFDFNLPERFDMNFINEKGEKERPYVLHRALFGSFERFIGVLIEHYAGAFPVWLAPVQVYIIPVGKGHVEYAKEIAFKLTEEGIRVEALDDSDTVGKKIRKAETDKIPYALIVGDKEIEAKAVAVRERGKGDTGQMKVKDFIVKIREEIVKRS